VNPTPFQKKLFLSALTALSAVAIGGVLFFIGSLLVQGISFLQPVLIPIAIAAILAFLLDPVVVFLMRWKASRLLSIILVYLAAILALTGILIWVLPPAIQQANSIVHNFGTYSGRVQTLAFSTMDELQKLSETPFLREPSGNAAKPPDQFAEWGRRVISDAGVWIQAKIPDLLLGGGTFLQKSIGGFLGVFGFLLSMILVPIFLFFFLSEGPAIAQSWSRYLPLRASPLKVEIVSLLSEINSYLISFFRGQLLVSIIEGIIVGVALLVMGLQFGLLIGLLVAILGIVPYLGSIISCGIALLIAVAQFGDWGHPLAVLIIFLVSNNLNGFFISPKIVGESVGLHPLTVIISVLAWSLILGGLLGALLAVPLTATMKVLLKRYFWDRPVAPFEDRLEAS